LHRSIIQTHTPQARSCVAGGHPQPVPPGGGLLWCDGAGVGGWLCG